MGLGNTQKERIIQTVFSEVTLKMKRLFILSAIGTVVLMVLSSSWAAANLNSSKSNIYRMVYPADLVSQAQAAAMLAEIDKLGPVNEAKLKQWLPANFKRFGIQQTRVKKISIFLEQQITCTTGVGTCKCKWVGPNLNARKAANAACFCYEPITSPTQVAKVDMASKIIRILLLTDPADEPQALAVSDPGKQGVKGTKDVP